MESAPHLVASGVGKPWAPWTTPQGILGAWLGHVLSQRPHRGQGTLNRVLPGGLITRGTGYGVSTRGGVGPRTVTAPRYRGQGARAEWDPGRSGQGQKPLRRSSDRQQGDRARQGPPDRSSPLPLVSCWVPHWLKPAGGRRTEDPLMRSPGAGPQAGGGRVGLLFSAWRHSSREGLLACFAVGETEGRLGWGGFLGRDFQKQALCTNMSNSVQHRWSSRAPPPHPPTEVWGRFGGFGLITSSKMCLFSEASVEDGLNIFTTSLHKSKCT